MNTQPNKSIRYKTALLSLAAFAAAFTAGVVMTAQNAQAQNSCKWYGTTSLKQQQLNQKKKCGFSGPTWHSNLAAHIEWCNGVSPDEWKTEVKKRGGMLAGCKN